MNKAVILYSNCIPVKGKNSAIICDLQRNSYVTIPNDLYSILTNLRGKSVFEIKKQYENKYDVIIDEYFQLLIENEFAFLTTNSETFPEMNLDFHQPFQVSNAIIDIDDFSSYKIQKTLKELSKLNCKFLQFRFFKLVEPKEIISILEGLEKIKSNTIGIEFLLNYNDSFTDISFIKDIFEKYKRLNILTLYSSTTELVKKVNSNQYYIYKKEKLVSENGCGLIKDKFSINIKTYTEAINYNSCLNKKISIDTKGNIKNCPSMPQSFGNIKDTTLEEALSHKDFKKYWNITKDQIDVCKDCEFRYICTDCRAYLEKPENMYSKPLKCGYSPYTNQWEEWSTNPLKQKAIEYYGMQDMVKKNNEV